MPAGSDISRAQVGYNRQTGQFGQQCSVEQLQGEAPTWVVSDRLAMCADRGDGLAIDTRGGDQAFGDLGVESGQRIGRESGALQFIVARLLKRLELGP